MPSIECVSCGMFSVVYYHEVTASMVLVPSRWHFNFLYLLFLLWVLPITPNLSCIFSFHPNFTTSINLHLQAIPTSASLYHVMATYCDIFFLDVVTASHFRQCVKLKYFLIAMSSLALQFPVVQPSSYHRTQIPLFQASRPYVVLTWLAPRGQLAFVMRRSYSLFVPATFILNSLLLLIAPRNPVTFVEFQKNRVGALLYPPFTDKL